MSTSISDHLEALPPLPYVAHQVLLAASDDAASASEVARALSHEPGLTARTVALANAAFFADQRPVYSPEDAIVRLGLNRVRVLVASIVLARQFDPGRCPPFRADRYWLDAVATAFAAARLARAAGSEDDRAYLGGLLHNIGLLLLAHVFPQEVAEALTRLERDPDLSLSATLRQALDVDHHEAGRLLLSEWALPSDIVTAVANAHRTDYRGPNRELTARVAEAARWARAGFAPEILPPAERLGLTQNMRQQLAEECLRELQQLEALARLLASG